MLGVKAIRRRLRRRALRRDGSRPEEEAYSRFTERFGPAIREGKPAEPQQEPQEPQEGPREEFQEDPRQERQQDAPPPPVPIALASPALEVLGLGAGASPEEIAAAYRRLARTYHPDKVAGETLEVREFAEAKMKQINAAYSELKLHR